MSAELVRELLQACLSASLAIALMLLLRKPLRRVFGAEAAYRCWLLVPAAMLAVWLPAPALQPGAPALPLGEFTARIPLGQALVMAPVDMSRWWLLAWIGGALACAALFAWRQRRFLRGLTRQPAQAFDLADAGGPAVVGGWRPRIVLPADFAEHYSREEQRLVLAHEQVHLARGDLHAQAVVLLLRCLFWFNPLVHLAARRFSVDQELACDAVVLARHPGERRTYADAMLKSHLLPFALPMACHWQSRHPLKERITMLMHPLPGTSRRIAGRASLIVLLVGGSYAAWAAQPAVAPDASPTTRSAGEPAKLTRLYGDEDLSPPAFPKDALAKGLEGKVVLDVVFGADGHARKVTVVSASPAGIFDKAAVEAALKWRLRPSDGKPVERTYRIPVQFTDHDPDAAVRKDAAR